VLLLNQRLLHKKFIEETPLVEQADVRASSSLDPKSSRDKGLRTMWSVA